MFYDKNIENNIDLNENNQGQLMSSLVKIEYFMLGLIFNLSGKS